MEINWIIIGVIIVGAIALVYFLIKRNQKDEKEYEAYLGEEEVTKENDIERGDLE